MQLRHPPVVAVEERQEILRQIVFVEFGQRADDTEIQRNIASQRLGPVGHINVARVHVGVEKAVREHLREKNVYAAARQGGTIDTHRTQAVDLAHRNTGQERKSVVWGTEESLRVDPGGCT